MQQTYVGVIYHAKRHQYCTKHLIKNYSRRRKRLLTLHWKSQSKRISKDQSTGSKVFRKSYHVRMVLAEPAKFKA